MDGKTVGSLANDVPPRLRADAVSALADPRRALRAGTACHSAIVPPLKKCWRRSARDRTELTSFIKGSKLGMKPMKLPITPDTVTSKRGKVTIMSTKSMRNLRRKCAEVRNDAVAWTFALTYGDKFPTAAISKKQFQTLQRWWNKNFPEVGAFQKREPQKRGATHYHLLCFIEDPETAKSVIRAISEKWCFIANSEYGQDQLEKCLKVHLHPSNCQKMKGKSFFSYLSKYLAKGSDAMPDGYVDQGGGNWWGYVNKSSIPWAEKVEEELEKEIPVAKCKHVERTFYRYRQYQADLASQFATSDLMKHSADSLMGGTFIDHAEHFKPLISKQLPSASPKQLRKATRSLLDPQKKFKRARKLPRQGAVDICTIHADSIRSAIQRLIDDSADLKARANIFGDAWTPAKSQFTRPEDKQDQVTDNKAA